MKILTCLILAIVLVSCGKRNSKDLEEKVQREIIVANEDMDRKATALENELATKQLFFTAVEGTFEGKLKIGDKFFKTTVSFIPSLPPYTSRRVRRAEEIIADLNNLFFTVQVIHWNSAGTARAGECVFSQVRPGYSDGHISASSSDSCSNVYQVNLFQSPEDGREMSQDEIKVLSRELAAKILRGEIRQINEVNLTLVAKSSSAKFVRINP